VLLFALLEQVFTKKDERIISNDQIDQQQTLWDGAGIGIQNPDLAAQSFKPSLNTITRIQIIACRDGNPSGIITLSIRSSLDGEDIVSASINAEDLEPDSFPIKTWVEFDFGEMPEAVHGCMFMIKICGYLVRSFMISWIFAL